MGAEIVSFRRSRVRIVFVAVAVAAAIGALFVHDGVADKNLALLSTPAFMALAAALVWPALWRASGGTRYAAFGYLGLPAGLTLTLPFAALPAAAAPFAALAATIAVAAVIVAYDRADVCRLSPGEGWIEQGRRRLGFDDVAALQWDGIAITTQGTFVESTTDIERLVLVGAGGVRIDLDTTRYPSATAMAAIQQTREWVVEAMVARIGAAVDRGETVTAGPLTIAPERLTLARPPTLPPGGAVFLLGLLAFFPLIAGFGRMQDDKPLGPLPFVLAVPLVVAIAVLVIARKLRRGRPLVFPAGTQAGIVGGDLVIAAGKRPRRFPVRFLTNGLLVPPLLAHLRDRAAGKDAP